MLQQFQGHISKTFPFLKKKKLLIAISGGVDSVVLTHLLHVSKFDIALAHCNFQLRDNESDLDQQFVSDLADKLQIKLFLNCFDTKLYATTNKVSIQIAARQLRYNWFQELVKDNRFDYILTAHHADDSIETFLINLSRGTGIEGLTGIPRINGVVIRPLLPFYRREIHKYAVENEILWREDASNQETKYLRNKIRYEIIPKLKELNSNFTKNISKTIFHLQQTNELVKNSVYSVKEEVVSKDGNLLKFEIDAILKLANPKVYLFEFLKEYGFTQWDDIFHLLTAQSGKFVSSKNYRLYKDRKVLILSPLQIQEEDSEVFFIEDNVHEINNPIHLTIKNVSNYDKNDKNTIHIDKKLVNFPLILRKWSVGDSFFPTGMTGKKKLSKFFKDEKMSLIEKSNAWILCSETNEIIWIVGKRLDRRFLANEFSEDIIKINI